MGQILQDGKKCSGCPKLSLTPRVAGPRNLSCWIVGKLYFASIYPDEFSTSWDHFKVPTRFIEVLDQKKTCGLI